MRILYSIMAYGPHIIASEVHSELGREFRAHGHQWDVWSLASSGGSDESGSAKFAYETAYVTLYQLKFGKGYLSGLLRRLTSRIFFYAFFAELVWGIWRFLRRHGRQYDLIHVEAAYPLGAAWAVASWLAGCNTPFILNLQGADVMSLPSYDYGYARYWLPRQLLRFAFRQCAGVRANSEQTAALALKLGANPAKIRVIYRNVSDNIFPENTDYLTIYRAEQQAWLRQKYGLGEGAVLVALSRLHPFKGLDFLMRALPAVRERLGAVNLLICGPSRSTPTFGDYRAYLEKVAVEAGVADCIVFTGKVPFEDSARYQAGADLLIVPSVVEALNKVVIESAAVGTPAVITETTGIAYPAVRDGVGVSVKAANEADLAVGIISLLEDTAQRQAMSQRGVSWAQKFRSAAIAAELEDFYQVALATPSKSIAYVAYPSSMILKSANAIQTYNTCRELKALNSQVTVLLPLLPTRSSQFRQIGATHLPRLPLNYFNNFTPLKKIPWSYAERSFFALLVGLYLSWRKITGRSVAVVYVRDVICAYWLTRIWRKLLGFKLIYEIHDLESKHASRNPALQKWLEQVDATLLAQADTLVSLTAQFLKTVERDGLRSASLPIAVIPDAFDDQFYQPATALQHAEWRTELEIAPDEFLAVYSGSTWAYRGVDDLLTAFAGFAHTTATPVKLALLGGRDSEQVAMRQLAARLNIASLVVLTGMLPADQVNRWLNCASALVIPGTVTGETASPLKLFEYAAVAKPVILPGIAALREILPDNAAIYFDVEDSAGLATALQWVANYPELANERAQAACRAVQPFTYRSRARAIMRLARGFEPISPTDLTFPDALTDTVDELNPENFSSQFNHP